MDIKTSYSPKGVVLLKWWEVCVVNIKRGFLVLWDMKDSWPSSGEAVKHQVLT